MKPEIIFKYKDEDDTIREVSFSNIVENIGFEYSIPDEVLKLTSAKEILEIKVNDEIVWSAIKRSYIGIICKNVGDFNLYIKENGLKGKRQTTKILHTENRTYVCFASVCDTRSWNIDNYYETQSAKDNKEYEEIIKNIRATLPSVAES